MEIANEKKIAGLVQFLRKGRTMTGRFKLPMLEEQAYEYLLAAYIMEVQLRYRRFIYNGFVEEQLKQVANCKHCKVRNRSMWRMRQRQDHYAQGIAEPCQTIGNPQTEPIA